MNLNDSNRTIAISTDWRGSSNFAVVKVVGELNSTPSYLHIVIFGYVSLLPCIIVECVNRDIGHFVLYLLSCIADISDTEFAPETIQ